MNPSLLHQQSLPTLYLPVTLGARKRRKAAIFPSKSPFLKLASSLAAISLRDLSPPPLDLLLDYYCRRLISFSAERRRRRLWNRCGLVGLLVSLAAALGISLLRESSEKVLRPRVLRVLGILRVKNVAWGRGDFRAFLLGFALCCLIWKGVSRKRVRSWRLHFW